MGHVGLQEPGSSSACEWELTHKYFDAFCSIHTEAQKARPKSQVLKGIQRIRNQHMGNRAVSYKACHVGGCSSSCNHNLLYAFGPLGSTHLLKEGFFLLPFFFPLNIFINFFLQRACKIRAAFFPQKQTDFLHNPKHGSGRKLTPPPPAVQSMDERLSHLILSVDLEPHTHS